MVTLVWGGGEGVLGEGSPPLWFLIILKKPWGGGRARPGGAIVVVLGPRRAVLADWRHPFRRCNARFAPNALPPGQRFEGFFFGGGARLGGGGGAFLVPLLRNEGEIWCKAPCGC